MPALVGEHWEVYAAPDGDEGRRVVTFDVDVLDAAARGGAGSSSRRVILEIPPEWTTPNGMPAPQASVPMRLAEDALLAALELQKIACRLVARLTWRGVREIAFQVEDAAGFDGVVAKWRTAQRWPTRVESSEGWRWFDEAVRPTEPIWMQIRNRGVVNELLRAGTDPEQPHRIEYVMKGPAAALEAIAAALAPQGFESTPDPDPESDVRVFTQESMLEVDEITEVTIALAALARDHGAVYDGWGAAVVPLPVCP